MPRSIEEGSGRSHKARMLAAGIKNSWPIRTALRLQREERRLQLDFDAAETPKARQDAAKALLAHRAALAEMLLLPKRPAAPRWKEPTGPAWYHSRRTSAGHEMAPVPIDAETVESAPESPEVT